MDEDFARYYWPNASAIGQRLWDGSEAGKDAEAFTVVGVVGGVKQAGLTEDEAQGAIYYPYAFRIGDSVFVAVRTSLPPESLGLTLQKVVRQIDADVPVNDLRSMDTRIADSLVARRSPALLGWPLLRDSSVAHRHRHLWSVELRRGTASPRDRRAHGPGCATRADPPPVFFSLPATARSRNAIGLDRSMAGRPSHAGGALPRTGIEPGDPRRCCVRHGDSVHRCLRAAISTRRADISDGGSRRGVENPLNPVPVLVKHSAHYQIFAGMRWGTLLCVARKAGGKKRHLGSRRRH